jgi:hypothetical protein
LITRESTRGIEHKVHPPNSLPDFNIFTTVQRLITAGTTTSIDKGKALYPP